MKTRRYALCARCTRTIVRHLLGEHHHNWVHFASNSVWCDTPPVGALPDTARPMPASRDWPHGYLSCGCRDDGHGRHVR